MSEINATCGVCEGGEHTMYGIYTCVGTFPPLLGQVHGKNLMFTLTAEMVTSVASSMRF